MPDIKLSPNEMDTQILKLAAELHFGIPGRDITSIQAILRDRDVPTKVIMDAIEILKKRGWITVSNPRFNNPRHNLLNHGDTVVAITTEGKDALRHLEANSQFNVRMPNTLIQEMQDFAAEARTTMSAAAIQFVQEGVRMARFPGIDFRWTPTGRVPHVTGTGLSVWEMFAIHRDHKENMAKIRENYPPLAPEQVHAGVAYARSYIHEMPLRPGKPPFAREVKAS